MSNIFDEEPELSESYYLYGQEEFFKKEEMKKLIAGMVRNSERPKSEFQSRMLLDFISENIQSRPDYRSVTKEEIKAEIERFPNDSTQR
jgi:hypothetical protein